MYSNIVLYISEKPTKSCVHQKQGTQYNSALLHIFEFCLRDMSLNYWIINSYDLQFYNSLFCICATTSLFCIPCFRGHMVYFIAINVCSDFFISKRFLSDLKILRHLDPSDFFVSVDFYDSPR